jgi:Lon protease-like protein
VEIPVFPLNTVLFPGGVLPLKVFEQRYISMTKACLRDGTEFGVCLIRDGGEVGAPAVPEPFGCLARIAQWDMPRLGVFQLRSIGTRRFRLVSTRAAPDGLLWGTAEIVAEDPATQPTDDRCIEVLRSVIARFGTDFFEPPLRYDDPTWVAYRLAEVLPIDGPGKQRLLEMSDPDLRQLEVAAALARAMQATG